jgi:rare lipoprotein A (peptidoglycan hydrolase)
MVGSATWYVGPTDTCFSGARYDPNALAGAVPQEMWGEYGMDVVKVCSDITGQCVVIVVNDIGPLTEAGSLDGYGFIVVDLTPAAFRALGMPDAVGRTPVHVTKLYSLARPGFYTAP